MSEPQPAPPSLFVISLPRSLSGVTYQAARAALGLAEPVWTTDGEVLNNDRFVMGGPGNDVGKKFTRPAWNAWMTRGLHAFLDQVVKPTGFAYKDVVQPFIVAGWLTAEPRGIAVLRVRRPLVDVAFSMLARGWLYPAHAQGGRVPGEVDVALLRGLMEAEAALDAVPAVEVEFDALVRDETALADALRELAPGRTPGPVRYVGEGFRAVAAQQLGRRGDPRYAALSRKLETLR
jgi:hypothetical protein